jgi:hypothetical protein
VQIRGRKPPDRRIACSSDENPTSRTKWTTIKGRVARLLPATRGPAGEGSRRGAQVPLGSRRGLFAQPVDGRSEVGRSGVGAALGHFQVRATTSRRGATTSAANAVVRAPRRSLRLGHSEGRHRAEIRPLYSRACGGEFVTSRSSMTSPCGRYHSQSRRPFARRAYALMMRRPERPGTMRGKSASASSGNGSTLAVRSSRTTRPRTFAAAEPDSMPSLSKDAV